MGFPGGTVVKNLPANARDVGSIPGSRRYLGVANCKLLQYPCPEEVHGVTKSQTQLSDFPLGHL